MRFISAKSLDMPASMPRVIVHTKVTDGVKSQWGIIFSLPEDEFSYADDIGAGKIRQFNRKFEKTILTGEYFLFKFQQFESVTGEINQER